jgi:TRAP-type C4-dicarboxylate transport system permease small subunit
MTGNGNHRLASFEEKFMGALDGLNLFLFILLIILASMQVSFRYLFFAPLPWTEELSRFFLVWVAFLGAASVTRRKLHILVDYLVSRIPLRANRIIGKILYLLGIAFMASVLWGSIKMMEDAWPVHLGSIPWLSVSFLYLGAVIGSAIMLFYLILHLSRGASFLPPEVETARPENAGQRGEVILTWLFLIVLLLLIFVGLPLPSPWARLP